MARTPAASLSVRTIFMVLCTASAASTGPNSRATAAFADSTTGFMGHTVSSRSKLITRRGGRSPRAHGSPTRKRNNREQAVVFITAVRIIHGVFRRITVFF